MLGTYGIIKKYFVSIMAMFVANKNTLVYYIKRLTTESLLHLSLYGHNSKHSCIFDCQCVIYHLVFCFHDKNKIRVLNIIFNQLTASGNNSIKSFFVVFLELLEIVLRTRRLFHLLINPSIRKKAFSQISSLHLHWSFRL